MGSVPVTLAALAAVAWTAKVAKTLERQDTMVMVKVADGSLARLEVNGECKVRQ